MIIKLINQNTDSRQVNEMVTCDVLGCTEALQLKDMHHHTAFHLLHEKYNEQIFPYIRHNRLCGTCAAGRSCAYSIERVEDLCHA